MVEDMTEEERMEEFQENMQELKRLEDIQTHRSPDF